MKKDGSTIFISRSKDYDDLWQDALRKLKKLLWLNENFAKSNLLYLACTDRCIDRLKIAPQEIERLFYFCAEK